MNWLHGLNFADIMLLGILLGLFVTLLIGALMYNFPYRRKTNAERDEYGAPSA